MTLTELQEAISELYNSAQNDPAFQAGDAAKYALICKIKAASKSKREKMRDAEKITYDRTFVYNLNLDRPDGNDANRSQAENQAEQARRARHRNKCDNVRNFFQTCTNFNFREKQFAQGHTPDDFSDWWHRELADKTPRDLVIIYHHGIAGNNGLDYALDLGGNPRAQVNAWNIVAELNRKQISCMLLLDSHLPTRFNEKWPCVSGTTELFARGAKAQDPQDHEVETNGDFTTAMIRNMRDFLGGINNVYRGYHTPRSIPDLMARDKSIDSHPLHILPNKPERGKDRLVIRLKIDPAHVRVSGRIEFFGYKWPASPRHRPDEAVAAAVVEHEVNGGPGPMQVLHNNAVAAPVPPPAPVPAPAPAQDVDMIGDEGVGDLNGPLFVPQ